MTTGATGQLGLALPVQGELSGTWGDTVNNGITQYTNIAIAGTLTLTGDGAVTLANTTGDASASNITSTLSGAGTVTAQFAIVKVTGTLTTAKVVTGPSYSKTYTVVNSATGGAVTFKASGQTGVSIAVGETAFVYYNGTDYVKVVGTATAGAAGGSNTQVQYNSSGVLAGSANMTFDGTSLTLGGNPTLSAGTANGVTYLNGSKVLTSGSALTFDGTTITTPRLALGGTTLPAAGTATLFSRSSDNNTYLQTGSGNIFYVLDGSQNTMMAFAPTALMFPINNAEQMRLTSTGLGIGTSSPAQTLHVKTATSATPITLGVLSNATGLPALSFNGAYASTTMAGIYANGATSTSLYYEVPSGNSHFWGIADSTKMTLDSAGNLGLGVTPSASWANYKVLQIGEQGVISGYASGAGVLNTGANFYWDGSGYRYLTTNPASLYQQNAGAHNWRIAASGTAGNAISFTQAMTLDASGNLGVGTTNPSRQLELSTFLSGAPTGTGFVGGALRLSNLTEYESNYGSGGGNPDFLGSIEFYTGDTSTGTGVRTAIKTTVDAYYNANSLCFYTAPSGTSGILERARIDSSGNLGLGVTPSASWTSNAKAIQIGARMAVYNDGSNNALFANNMYFDGSYNRYIATAASARYYLATDGSHIWNQAPSGTAGDAISFTQAMTLDTSGRLGIGTTSPTTILHTSSSTAGIFAQGTSTKTNNLLFTCSNSYNYGVVGVVSGDNTSGGDIYALGYVASAGGSFNPVASWTSGGNLLVGGTSANAKVTVETTTNQRSIQLDATNSSTFTDVIIYANGYRNTTNGSWKYLSCAINGVGEKLQIIDSGTVNNATGTYGTISDARLKQDIVDAPSQWADIKAIRFRKYRMKLDVESNPNAPTMLGVVAQELELVSPNLVDESNNEDGTTTKTVKQSILLMKAAVALQEAMTRIEQLEARLDAANL